MLSLLLSSKKGDPSITMSVSNPTVCVEEVPNAPTNLQPTVNFKLSVSCNSLRTTRKRSNNQLSHGTLSLLVLGVLRHIKLFMRST